MDTATMILLLGGLFNLAFAQINGFMLAKERRTGSEAHRYLVAAHMSALLQAPLLISLIFALNWAALSEGMKVTAAWLLVISSVLQGVVNMLNWWLNVQDEFLERKPHGVILGIGSALTGVAGLWILIYGVFRGFSTGAAG